MRREIRPVNREDRRKRKHPGFPRLGVGILVFNKDRFLLIKRGQAPYKGKWTIPGGLVRVGETLAQAAARELFEECRVRANLAPAPTLFEFIQPDKNRIAYHYVIADFIGEYLDGDIQAGSDAGDAAWYTLEEADRLEVTPGLRDLIIESGRHRQDKIQSG